MDVQKKKLDSILKTLDQRYGTEKEGFQHEEEWQLLAAIMLSAQSTDKQVDEALPGLFSRFKKAEDVAEASQEEIEGYIRSVGLYKNKAKNLKMCIRDRVDAVPGVPLPLRHEGCGKPRHSERFRKLHRRSGFGARRYP